MRPYAVSPDSSTSSRVFVRLFSTPSMRVPVCLFALALFSSTLFAQDSDRQYQPEAQQDQQHGYQTQYYPPGDTYGGNSQQQPYAEQPHGNDSVSARGSEAPAQSYANVQSLSEAQLEPLVAPIALYPDVLVAEVLAASTYPQQVADADLWRRSQGYAPPDQIVVGANAQNWDPSVKALTAFPQVLSQMNRNMQWTTDLGNAYYNQPQDVLHAVQVMRWRAQDAGSLRSTPQEAVDYQQGNIVLAPPNQQVVYVPEYNPWIVYGAPVAPYPGFSMPAAVGSFIGDVAVRFGWGIATAAFAHSPFGLLAWGLDWLAHAVLFHGSTYYSHSITVRDWGLPHGGPRAFSRGGAFAAWPNRPDRRGDFDRGNSGFRNFRAQESYRAPAYRKGNRDLYARARPQNYHAWEGSRENFARSSDEGLRSFRSAPNQPLRQARSHYDSALNSRGTYAQDFYRQGRDNRQNNELRPSGYAGEIQADRALHSNLEHNFGKHSDSFRADKLSRSFAKNNHSAEQFGHSREFKESRSEKSYATAKNFGKSRSSEHSHSGGHEHQNKHHG
jgi:Protein of unknown function (DUF3300)